MRDGAASTFCEFAGFLPETTTLLLARRGCWVGPFWILLSRFPFSVFHLLIWSSSTIYLPLPRIVPVPTCTRSHGKTTSKCLFAEREYKKR